MTSPVTPLSMLVTFGWALLAFVLAQIAGTATIAIWNLAHGQPLLEMSGYDGTVIALLTLITNPVQIAFLATVARRWLGADPVEYFALKRFTLRDLLVGVLALIVLAAAIEGFKRVGGFDPVSTFESEIYTTSRASGWLPALIFAIVVVGPVGEEIMFRGFMFRGWVTPGWRGVIAVVVITLLWSAMHLQYDWFGISQVFLTGLVLGWIRQRSGSTALTIVLHMLVNLESTIEAMTRGGGAA
jgi:membrane protease YdiL (CAAX protease family)